MDRETWWATVHGVESCNTKQSVRQVESIFGDCLFDCSLFLTAIIILIILLEYN